MGTRLIVLLLAAAAACNRAGAGPVDAPTELVVSEPPVVLATLHSGITDERRAVVRTHAEWAAFWNELVEAGADVAAAPPFVDFTARMVVIATLGTRERAGYDIHIPEYRLDGGTSTVDVLKTTPGAGCAAGPVLTTPLAAAAVHRAAHIVFRELEIAPPCRTD
jgi:hypothetical protein